MTCEGTVFDKEGLPEEIIEVSNRGTSGLAVFVQDQTTEALTIPFLLNKGNFTLDGDTTRDTRFFDASPGHLIIPGDIVELFDASTFMQARVLNVVLDAIELDIPINHVYSGGLTGTRATDDLRVNGSITPQVFKILPSAGQSGDMTRVILRMESSSSMDFTKFGSLAPLDVGCVLRIKRPNGDFRNQFNFKTNGDFIEKCYDNNPQSKSGGGGFGMVFRLTYAGQGKHGVAIRLDGEFGEEWQIVIQDDLTTGFTKLGMSAGGHELQG